MKHWFKNPKAPASNSQKIVIRGLLKFKGLTEKWLCEGIKKQINELTMSEADQVIKKISKIKNR